MQWPILILHSCKLLTARTAILVSMQSHTSWLSPHSLETSPHTSPLGQGGASATTRGPRSQKTPPPTNCHQKNVLIGEHFMLFQSAENSFN